MANCLNPVQAYICGTRITKDGVLSPHLVFSHKAAVDYYTRICCLHNIDHYKVAVPCGHCINCQMRKRKDMSVRLAHEASCFDKCCFLTLTYDDAHVPTTCWNALDSSDKMFDRGAGSLPELTLMPRDVQGFMKRLRSHLKYHFGIQGIRYFAVGEYGGRTHRPHYHVLIFGWSPDDLQPLKMHNGNVVYTSSLIQSKWKFGYSSVSEVTPFVARYAARYVTKKFARLKSGDSDFLVPEFTLQSTRNGGIGATWFDKFGEHSCCVGYCTLRCSDSKISKHAIPRYYYSRLRKRNISLWLKLRDERLEFVKSHGVKFDFEESLRSAARAENDIKNEIDKETF